MPVFHCPWLLTTEGWLPNRRLAVDDRGFIIGLSAHGEATEYLPGPVMPGMANVHSHAHQRLIAGLTGLRTTHEDSFWNWREQMYRAVDVLDTARFRAVASWLFTELLEGGYTSVGEFHYLHRQHAGTSLAMAQALVDAALETGMNLTLLPVWYRYSGFGRRAPTAQQKPFVIDALDDYVALVGELRRMTAANRNLVVGIAPHSLRAVEVSDLSALLGAVPDGPVHLHIAEQTAEIDQCLAHCKITPIHLLCAHVELDARWCLIHATHATSDELRLVTEAGCVIGLCPTTEADLGDGLFPATEYMAAGGRMAIGSDSNLRTSASEELRLLEWSQRYRHQRRNRLAEPGQRIGDWLWQHTTTAGHAAIGQPAGILAPGQRADFVVLDAAHPLLDGHPAETAVDQLVFAADRDLIHQVWTAGQLRVTHGRHHQREALQPGWSEARRALFGYTDS